METISYNLIIDISSHLIFYSLKTVAGTVMACYHCIHGFRVIL